MKLLNISSPHTTRPGNTGDVMKQVLLAMIPGIIAVTYFFGPGHLIQIALAVLLAVGAEAAATINALVGHSHSGFICHCSG